MEMLIVYDLHTSDARNLKTKVTNDGIFPAQRFSEGTNLNLQIFHFISSISSALNYGQCNQE
jgi:hypothetical protein